MKVHLRILGKGKPLVFFHGFGFDHRIWLSFCPYLQEHYSLYLVDLPGFGKTAPMEWEDFVEALLLLLPLQFAVVGWSLGGLYALQLALQHRQRVTHLLGIATSPRFSAAPDWPGISEASLSQFWAILQQDSSKALSHFVALQLPKEHKESYIPSIASEKALISGFTRLSQGDIRTSLSEIAQPTGFIFGRLDKIVPATTLEVMQKKYPSFQYALIKKAAHIPFLSHPLECKAIIEEVLIL
jgi:pimeloyl-[acyl-carrier protein] methyl ester esterase